MQVADGVAYLRRLDLRHLTAHGAYLVAMAVVVVASLILGDRLEAVTYNQPQLNEELQGVIQRRPADGKAIVVHKLVAQLLYREVSAGAVHRIQHGKPLRRFSQSV